MQEVKYRVVRKNLKEVKQGDALWPPQFILTAKKGVFREWLGHEELEEIGSLNPDGTYNVMELIEDVAESATTEVPSPETATVEINGERFTVTRKPCGGWSEPVPWSPAVGDEVRLSDLTDGDRVLIPGVVQGEAGEIGKIGVRLPRGNDCLKWFRTSVQVIYNGRAEQ